MQIDPETFGFLISDLARLIRADLDRRIVAEGMGITPGEARTLLYAARAGEVRQNVLAERMGLEAMTLSAYLDRLEERGLVQRIADPLDRRAKLVRLTDRSDDAILTVMRIGADVRARARRGMTDEEWTALNDMLKRVRANFQDI